MGTDAVVTERALTRSAPQMRALLAGAAQIRVPIRPLTDNEEINPGAKWVLRSDGIFVARGALYMQDTWEPGFIERRCQFGRVGDRLYVKEAWGVFDADDVYRAVAYKVDLEESDAIWLDCGARWNPGSGGNGDEWKAEEPSGKWPPDERWRSSVVMPRWAARLILEVVEVRAQRFGDSEPPWIALGEITSETPPGPIEQRIGDYVAAWNAQYARKGATWAPELWTFAATVRRATA